MPDMLVPLYRLPPVPNLAGGLTIRPALPFESHVLLEFVGRHFSPKWVDECTVALAVRPARLISYVNAHLRVTLPYFCVGR